MVKMQTGPVTPTMTRGWPAATAKTLPQRNVDMSTSTSPILPAVLCARKAPKVMAGLIDVKNMKIAAESALGGVGLRMRGEWYDAMVGW